MGRDVISLLDALEPGAMIAGFDWGELSACVAAALWPDRVAGLVSLAGYDVIDVERLRHTLGPALEQVLWYQHLFHRTRPPVPAR